MKEDLLQSRCIRLHKFWPSASNELTTECTYHYSFRKESLWSGWLIDSLCAACFFLTSIQALLQPRYLELSVSNIFFGNVIDLREIVSIVNMQSLLLRHDKNTFAA